MQNEGNAIHTDADKPKSGEIYVRLGEVMRSKSDTQRQRQRQREGEKMRKT